MAKDGPRAFVGFGFGPIQAGLFLYEAHRAGAFGRLVVAEVDAKAVSALRSADGIFSLNIARPDRVEAASVGFVEPLNPGSPSDRGLLIEAIAEAHEIATAVPSVDFYATDSPASLHRLLAGGLRIKASGGGPRAVVYAAENHNRAAEILEEKVLGEIPASEREAVARSVRFLNTVIGKMSGVVTGAEEIRSRGLRPVTLDGERAFLVEEFNRILISRIDFGGKGRRARFERGISVFEEKPDLLPFEEAKLHGHNAAHALAAYLAMVKGVELISELRRDAGMMEFLRSAFIEESGAALVRRHARLDRLFTPEGFSEYAEGLLVRMTNPYLGDTAARVGRDVGRKLGWDDRLVGTMRLAMSQGVEPRRYAFGAAAACATIRGGGRPPREFLERVWQGAAPEGAEKSSVLTMVSEEAVRLAEWKRAGCPDLSRFWARGSIIG